jgi:hypothetical protein
LVPLPPSQLTDGLPAWGELKNRSGSGSGGNGSSSSGAWWRRRRRSRGGKGSNASGLVGASKPPNSDENAEFYDDLAAIIEPYRAYMDLRPVEMRPELLSAAPSSVAGGGSGGGGGLVGASAPGEKSASAHGDVALFPSYNPKMMAAMPSSLGAGSSLLDGAPGEKKSFESFEFSFFFFLERETEKKKLTLFALSAPPLSKKHNDQVPSSTPPPLPGTQPTSGPTRS